MKSADMVKQLRATLPLFTDVFNDVAQIVGLSQAGNTVTAILDASYTFKQGQQVVVRGSVAPVVIISIDRVGSIATAVTATPHDITFNPAQPVNTSVTLVAAESEFSGTFDLLSSDNRTTFTFEVPDSGPIVGTGGMELLNPPEPVGYNGTQTLLADTTGNTIQYDLPVTGLAPAIVDNASVNFNIRVTNTTSIARAIEMYTKMDSSELWAFVALQGTTASRDRNTFDDSVTAAAKGGDRQQQIYQNISVYVFAPTTGELSGADAADGMQDVAADLFKSVLFWSAPTDLAAEDDTGVRFVAHGEQQEYNTAYYIHEFQFQMLTSIYREDTIDDSNDVAFRDIDLSITTDLGTGELTASIDLDDKPIGT